MYSIYKYLHYLTQKFIHNINSVAKNSKNYYKLKNRLNTEQTKKKRKSQSAVIIKTKIDSDKLNNNTRTALNRIFLEAKWLYNYIIND